MNGRLRARRRYRQLLAWARSFGVVGRAGVEGTGCYGAALTRYLRAQNVRVLEVNRPDRAARRHPILDRLERAGWITGEWETLEVPANRPRRRYYRLTPGGAQLASDGIASTLSRIAPSRWRTAEGTS